MRLIQIALTLIITVVLADVAWATEKKKVVKKTTYRKTQEVSFDGADIDGVARSPDGAYLLQKRGIKFMPLYRAQKHFDNDVKESIEYLK